MNIKYINDRVDEPKGVVRDRIISRSELVKFGFNNFFKFDNWRYTKPWLGEYNFDLDEFKLFKTKVGTDRTSDFYIKGRLIQKINFTDVRFTINVNSSLLLGIFGLNVFAYAIVYLLATKGWLSTTSFWIPIVLVLSSIYVFAKRKDYTKTVKSFRELINSKNITAYKNGDHHEEPL